MSERTLNDPVFGAIVGEDGYWEKQDLVPFLGYDVDVSITCGSAAEPDDAQRARFLQFLEKRDQLKAELEEAIFNYYQEVYENYQVIWDEVDENAAEKNAPTLTSSEAIWTLIEPSAIGVLPQDPTSVGDSDADFDIQWGTSWDVEHSLLVSFQDWKILSVELY
ncbi:MAG: hypothetical protein ABIY70_01420 [Capsulimonas sp.]|uniref:DUF6985 domain-containing protein n=1 Tax=Capsulimonas sp. TaxID=2494211 RepID=UPI0032654D4D